MTRFTQFLMSLLLMIAIAMGSGCLKLMTAEELGLAKPINRIKATKNIFGASLTVEAAQDTKHTMNLRKATYNEETGAWDIEGLSSDYQGDASTVVTANVAQLKEMAPILEADARREEARGRAIAMIVQAGGDAAGNLAKFLVSPLQGATMNLSGPLGQGAVKLGGGTEKGSGAGLGGDPPPGG